MPSRPKSAAARRKSARPYVFGHWGGLCVFLDDGRVEMDTNTIERGMRPQKLTAKNALFAGSDAGARSWAIVASLIETCKLNGVEPFAYLKDVLQSMGPPDQSPRRIAALVQRQSDRQNLRARATRTGGRHRGIR